MKKLSKALATTAILLVGLFSTQFASAAVQWFEAVPTTVSVEGANIGIIDFGRSLTRFRVGCASIRTRVAVNLDTPAGRQAHRLATSALLAGRPLSISYDDNDCTVIINSWTAWYVGIK